ncbi:MAG: tRNA pseudouridine(38-40) synthase TruA [Muribaculaceae bacterium]|nr:tRNA pseudouridine(38-40) synthase TruA [Muribaculaceae bacterium]
MRYFIRLAYNGAPFHGWQIQPHDNSVQEVLEQALGTVLRTPVAVTGAGRTDTGVNARTMYAHFDVDAPIADVDGLCRSLNGLLGRDVAVYAIFPVADDAHARFDATSRTYKYFLHTAKSPFLYPLSWECHFDLDFDLMNEAAEHLLHYTDFTSFSKLHTDVKTNNCRVTHARWERVGEQWVFTITADRFLRNMVRAVVGTLVEVGRHRISVDEFCRIIEAKDRCEAGNSMPGNALFLWDITYPFPLQ